jgi:hypothetical protein
MPIAASEGFDTDPDTDLASLPQPSILSDIIPCRRQRSGVNRHDPPAGISIEVTSSPSIRMALLPPQPPPWLTRTQPQNFPMVTVTGTAIVLSSLLPPC